MRDRVTLSHDLTDCRGATIARKGFVISPESISEVARKAPRVERLALQETPHRGEVAGPLDEAQYGHLFGAASERALVEKALLEVRLPEVLFEELTAMQGSSPPLYRHGLITAAVAVRMLLALVGDLKGVPDLAAAALLHDLGMRHLPPRLVRAREGLGPRQAADVASHPLLGAYHLASVLGEHPAVAAAHGHHWACGQGYPILPAPPSRSTEVVAVASAFAALTQPRPYRSEPYDVRAAADLLVSEAKAGTADGGAVKLLVAALRGRRGDSPTLRFGSTRAGQVPEQNRHTKVAPPDPERS